MSDDARSAPIVEHWKNQAPEPYYDESLFQFVDGDDGGGSGQFGWLAKMTEDDMVVRARRSCVTSSQKASASMLQTKLKVGLLAGQPADGRARTLRDHRSPGPA